LNVVEINAINVAKPVWTKELEGFCLHVLKRLGRKRWNVSILLCDDAFIRALNGRYRGKYEPTDVLSFGQGPHDEVEGFHVAGDIVISLETMKKNAAEHDIPEEGEVKRLLVHGLLHLSGMDHGENDTGGEMLDLQERILGEDQETTF